MLQEKGKTVKNQEAIFIFMLMVVLICVLDVCKNHIIGDLERKSWNDIIDGEAQRRIIIQYEVEKYLNVT